MLGNPVLDIVLIAGIATVFIGCLLWFRARDNYGLTRESVHKNIRAMTIVLVGLALWDTSVLFSDTSIFGKVAVVISWLGLLILLTWLSRNALRRLSEAERTAADIGTLPDSD